jgi:hypothetical protein
VTANTKWGSGPWDNEPDHVEFEAHGFKCEIRRADYAGHLCGYVVIPEGHPWHGADEVDASVHGGVTWSEVCRDGLYRVGFDCGHDGDLSPVSVGFGTSHPDEVYRTIRYVREELMGLARQAKEFQP